MYGSDSTCANALVPKTFTPPTQTYSSGATIQIASGYEIIFTHIDKLICPITSVEVKNEGCSDAISGGQISIDSTSPYPITAIRSVVAGYTKKFCVKVTTTPVDLFQSAVSKTKDSITMKQTADCSVSL